ncbi:MAG: hypothetical protein ABEJ03_04540 [Candidatus Nanohaloarchaea archaeon]
MNIESELPEDFDSLSEDEKVARLLELEDRFDDSTDEGAIKRCMVEELIRKYS